MASAAAWNCSSMPRSARCLAKTRTAALAAASYGVPVRKGRGDILRTGHDVSGGAISPCPLRDSRGCAPEECSAPRRMDQHLASLRSTYPMGQQSSSGGSISFTVGLRLPDREAHILGVQM